MIINREYDKDGNIIYEEYDTGYKEYNTYYKGVLIRQECRYPNGMVEIDHYKYNE